MKLEVVIMAAGKGTRMKSRLPKVLQKLAGKPLLAHVLDMVSGLQAHRVVTLTGHGADQVEEALAGRLPQQVFARQEPQLGTGHAVMCAAPQLEGTDAADVTLILNGDVPLTSLATARRLIEASQGGRLALLTVTLADPSGYGRILRDGEQVLAIREHKDASEAERLVNEVYTGMMAVPTAWLKSALPRIGNDNAQKEYYLTDLVALAREDGVTVVSTLAANEGEVLGVNSPQQLAQLERLHQLAIAEQLMVQGVRLADPARLDVRGALSCGQDVEIDVGCVFEGSVQIGDDVVVGAHCVIRDALIGPGARIAPFTHIDGAQVGEGSLIGPFARLRPGARLDKDVHIGNFVEVKNSHMAEGAKANHLAYLGDAEVGPRVNYGAGAITANYDGANKHKTVIGADAHIGSNCVLVAPVSIGAGGTVGAGSTVSKDTPPGGLTVARARQAHLAAWSRPVKTKK
ncbi:MAG: UDP-N-acetylglucosamine diphosphorylase/glucosamine-1-phosphate N-acetyltransferase [Burkholderiaceae bacterium]|nr:MAG: UDP-N-acetylglucosamine diphosphorylase/glucosamine-1-phosphate N-acetyltransferase [Burkholderiaceae bacterium]